MKNIFKYYFGKEKKDTINLLLAYNGCLLMTHFMIWSYQNYGVWGANPITYLTNLGGIL